MVHISKLENFRVEKVEDVVKEGDVINVKFLGTDEKGRMNLSKKDAPQPQNAESAVSEDKHYSRPLRKPE